MPRANYGLKKMCNQNSVMVGLGPAGTGWRGDCTAPPPRGREKTPWGGPLPGPSRRIQGDRITGLCAQGKKPFPERPTCRGASQGRGSIISWERRWLIITLLGEPLKHSFRLRWLKARVQCNYQRVHQISQNRTQRRAGGWLKQLYLH